MDLEYYTLDVFTEHRFSGNPLAVVLGADGLETDVMQRVAAEFNLSETVFVQAPQNPAHSARVRIFTPRAELPFAGHPTIGSGALLAELRAKEVGGGGNALVTLEENIGLVRVGARMVEGGATFAEFDAPKLPVENMQVPAPDDLASATGLIPGEIGFANHRPTRFSAGVDFNFVPVSTLDAIGKAAANLAYWSNAFGSTSDNGAFLYTSQVVNGKSHYHARMFAPGHGIMEDPATGSAAAAFAGVIAKFDEPPPGSHKRLIEQGIEMGRPSEIYLSLEIESGGLANVRIGGEMVRVSQGRITVA